VSEDKFKDIKRVRKRWDEHANRYDEWYKSFEGAVEHYVDWELLKEYLPPNKDAKILDAAGGTGRITLPLAKMGYSVTLCDISSKMLDVARRKIKREGVSDRVKILECDVHNLPLPDENFDFVLCWDGIIESINEFVRFIKKGGKISVYLINRCRAAIDLLGEDPIKALKIIKSDLDYIHHHEIKQRAMNSEEARKLFEGKGIRILDIYAVYGWLDVLSIPEEVQKSTSWDDKYFNQVAELVLNLSKEPQVSGMSRHLVLYGEKI